MGWVLFKEVAVRAWLRFGWFFLPVVLWGIEAFGSPFRIIGYDGYAISKANSQSVYGGGIGVLYSNPALLMDEQSQLSLGLFVHQPHFRAILFDRPNQVDVPITIYESDIGSGGNNLDRALPTCELPNPRADNRQDELAGYMGIGMIHSLGVEDFRIGFSLLVPSQGFLSASAHYADEREQVFSNTVHFVRIGEYGRSIEAFLGAAYRPAPGVNLGFSLETSLYAQATTGAYVPEATVQDYAQMNIKLEGGVKPRAVFGISVDPADMLRLSLVWRDRRYIGIESDALINLWNFHEPGSNGVEPKRVRQHQSIVLDFEPMEVNLAVGLTVGSWKWEAGLTWNHWADYIDDHHKRAQETAVFEDPNHPGTSSVNAGRFAFSDTYSLSTGGSFEPEPGHILLGGLSYRPSPVPKQIGRTNYVDNDLLVVGLGYRMELVLGDKPARLDFGIQSWYLVPVEVNKDPEFIRDEFADHAKTLIDGQPMLEAQGLQTNNPGFPGYKHDGWALAGSISLSYLF